MSNTLSITGNFDGGNPKDPGSIVETGPNAFTIIPFSEDNDPNYKFRLDVKVINRSSETQRLDLTIDWQEPKFNYLRNYVYTRNAQDIEWTLHPMAVSSEITYSQIDLQPGENYLCLNPKYNYEDYVNFIHDIPETKILNKEKLGISPENRELWMVKINGNKSKPQKRIMIVSRIHPYETAGSYCMEGIVDYFTKTDPDALSASLRNITIYLMPMANLDGVYNGLCKLTRQEGVDLSKQVDNADPISYMIAKCINKVQPDIYCELHNWMFPDIDGIYFLNWVQARQFKKKISSQKPYKKRWKIFLRKKMFAISPIGFKKYCREKFNSTSFVLEFPWHYRRSSDMKKLGIDALKALVEIKPSRFF